MRNGRVVDEDSERHVTFARSAKGGLGIKIKGGEESNLPVVITHISPGSEAEKVRT